jgi:predicted ATPase/class 3 adenylate cyclase
VQVSTADMPAGVVTFLFTDVEGSTRRWEADPDRMRVALAAHDDVLRDAIEAHGGWLFKHTGDGVCAAFTSPRCAVDAATAAQRALELPVRMGLATGEAELRGADYFGPALNRAARVMAAGHGGQILLADSTAKLISGVDLLGLGSRRLRDVPTPLGLFQVRAPGLRTNFPALRALDVTPGNLRAQTTSFVGREAEVDDVTAAIRAHRLVTLTGVGGVGKTRLAVEAAARVADEFPDGVWLFELAAVGDPAAVPDAVASVLGVTQQPDASMAESLATALEERLRLLVIDNCEHLLDAAGDLIETILARSATVRILATSREGLGLPDEQLWPVPSLDVAPDSAAVTLFIERARSVAPRFSPATNDDASAVVEICRRLDGIPLGIELAASRLAAMTVREIRDRLDQRFKLLVGSRRALERHQTLRHAVQWSYDLLEENEKALLERCSVFAGGFDLDSACAVGGFSDPDEFVVLDLLDALVRKSLLVADRSASKTRYSMLETIRQFAEDKLVERGEAAAARTAHAHHFAQREADILALWDSPQQREAYEWLTVELANLRAAFRWAADADDLDAAATIATYAAWVGYAAENYEPIVWNEELIERARAVQHPRLAFLQAIAPFSYLAGRLEAGIRHADIAIRDGLDFGDVPFGLEALSGGVYLIGGQSERWVELCRQKLTDSRDTHALARSSMVLASTVAGSTAEAVAATTGLIEAAEAADNPYATSYALLAYGFARRDADPVAALDALRRGLAIAQDSGCRGNESHLAVSLARLEAEHGDPLAALDYVLLATRNFHNSGNEAVFRSPLAILATFLDRQGRYDAAATIAGFAASPLTVAAFPEINTAITHLREVLGERTYESLAGCGHAMTVAAMATYAYERIDEVRTSLSA